jgi:hypothetical protein
MQPSVLLGLGLCWAVSGCLIVVAVRAPSGTARRKALFASSGLAVLMSGVLTIAAIFAPAM